MERRCDHSPASLLLLLRSFSLMRTVGVADFNIGDINTPEYKRTRRNLSGLINFAKFREERIAKYTEETAKTEQVRAIATAPRYQKTNRRLAPTPSTQSLTADCRVRSSRS